MRKFLGGAFSTVLVLAIFYFLGREFAANWPQIQSYPLHFAAAPLIAASLLYALSFILLGTGWHIILRYLGHNFPLTEAILYFCITQPAKYIPGKIWIAVTRIRFCKKHLIPNSITILSTGIEAVLEIFAGAYVSLIALLQTGFLGRFSVLGMIILSILGFVLLIPKIFYFLINVYLRIVKQTALPEDHRASFFKLLGMQMIYIAGLLVFGFSQLLFLQSFAPIPVEHFPFLISIGVFSYIAGIIAVFSPGGLGVREGIWYLALEKIAAPAVSLLYSFISRLWMIILEILLAMISLVWFKLQTSVLRRRE